MKKLVIAAAVLTTAVATVIGYKVYAEASFIATTEREPFISMGLNQTVLREAYDQMFSDVLHGRLNIDDKTEAEMDALLLQRYDTLTSE